MSGDMLVNNGGDVENDSQLTITGTLEIGLGGSVGGQRIDGNRRQSRSGRRYARRYRRAPVGRATPTWWSTGVDGRLMTQQSRHRAALAGSQLSAFAIINNLDDSHPGLRRNRRGRLQRRQSQEPNACDIGLISIDVISPKSGSGVRTSRSAASLRSISSTSAAMPDSRPERSISLINNAQPAPDDYQIINAASVSGRFGVVTGTIISDPDNDNDADVFFVPIYGNSGLHLLSSALMRDEQVFHSNHRRRDRELLCVDYARPCRLALDATT